MQHFCSDVTIILFLFTENFGKTNRSGEFSLKMALKGEKQEKSPQMSV